MVSQKQRSETTRARLIAAFRESFLKSGVDATTTESVLAQTGLSKGALYHHFRSKTEIAEAIYEAESRGAIDRAVASVDPERPPLIRLREVCVAWLDEVRDRAVARILFGIGPQVLGPMRAKEIEDRYSLALFGHVLDEAIARGDIELDNPELTARLINAVVAEAALHRIRGGAENSHTIAEVIDAILRR